MTRKGKLTCEETGCKMETVIETQKRIADPSKPELSEVIVRRDRSEWPERN